jgi:hypothetical protein
VITYSVDSKYLVRQKIYKLFGDLSSFHEYNDNEYFQVGQEVELGPNKVVLQKWSRRSENIELDKFFSGNLSLEYIYQLTCQLPRTLTLLCYSLGGLMYSRNIDYFRTYPYLAGLTLYNDNGIYISIDMDHSKWDMVLSMDVLLACDKGLYD